MSVKFSSAVWKAKIGDPVAKHVLLKLADNANDAGECWPSVASRSAETELSQRTIQTKVRFLETLGVLTSNRGINWCKYRLNMDALESLFRVQDVQGAGRAGCISRHSTPQDVQGGVQDVQLHLENHHRTVTKPSKASLATPLPFQTESFAEAWKTWLQHRKEIKKPVTPQSAKMAFTELSQMTEPEAIAAIRFSIKKGWRGIFPDPSFPKLRSTTEIFKQKTDGPKLRPFD